MRPAPSHLASPAAALLAAACLLLLPFPTFAFQSDLHRESAAAPGASPHPELSAREQEADLGLTGPANPRLPSLILVGDSTVRNGHGRGSDGLWGWGAPLADLFDPARINVVNRAIGGLSSHSYISQGHWALTLQLVKPGDFVLIQFGHNDGGLTLPGGSPVPDQGLEPAGASPIPRGPNIHGSLPGTGNQTLEVENNATQHTELVHSFGWYLRQYIADVRAKGATPILCSLVPRKIWVEGRIRRNVDTYQSWTRSVAQEEHVLFLDLNEIVARRYDAMGPDAVNPLFGDPHTHTTRAGAELNAQSVVAALRALPGHPLDRYLSAKGKAIPREKS